MNRVNEAVASMQASEHAPHRAVGSTRSLALVALTLLVLLFLFPFETGPDKFIWRPFFDAGHFGLMLLFTPFVLAWMLTHSRAPYRNTFLCCLLFAGGTEIIQPLFGRSASFIDLRNGTLGVSFGMLLGALLLRRPLPKLNIALFLLLCALLQLVLLYPAWEAVSGRVWRERSFPTLADFEETSQLHLWSPLPDTTLSLSAAQVTEGTRSLQLEGPEKVGVEYFAGDADWSAFRALSLQVWVPKQHHLAIRIDDAEDCTEYEQRYNTRIPLEAGWNEVRLAIDDIADGPVERSLDLKNIRRMLLYIPRKEGAVTFYLDDMKLE